MFSALPPLKIAQKLCPTHKNTTLYHTSKVQRKFRNHRIKGLTELETLNLLSKSSKLQSMDQSRWKHRGNITNVRLLPCALGYIKTNIWTNPTERGRHYMEWYITPPSTIIISYICCIFYLFIV